jgi:hypothetical protein
MRSGEMRPCAGDIASGRAAPSVSSSVSKLLGGSNRCALNEGSGEPKLLEIAVVPDITLLPMLLA